MISSRKQLIGEVYLPQPKSEKAFSSKSDSIRHLGDIIKSEVLARIDDAIPTKPDPAFLLKVSFEQSLLDLTNEGLGYLYVLVPGHLVWEKFHVLYKNCMLYFSTSMKSNPFKHVYALTYVITRRTKKYVT